MRPFAALVLFSLALAACDSTGVEPVVSTPETGTEAPPSVLLPLAVGNAWTYRVVRTRLAADGITVAAVDTLAEPATIRVVGTVEIDGETWYRIAREGAQNAFFYTLLANRADGLYGRGDYEGAYVFKLAAFPAPVGFQFGTSTWAGTVDNPTGVSTDSDVTLKVTDFATTVGSTAYEGLLFTTVVQRFRIEGTSYEVEAFARPFHNLLVPDVGYARFQGGYYQVVEPGVMRQNGILTSTLTSFTLVPQPA